MTSTSTEQNETMADKPRLLTPEEIGVLVKAFRDAHGWTQETLAEISGLQTRTIQRVERGDPSSPDTCRALGRAFKFEDIDFFNTSKSIPTDDEIHKQKEAFDKENLVLDARMVDGRQFLILLLEGADFKALVPMSAVDLPREAQNAFLTILDFTRDCMDVFDVASQSEILGYGDGLDANIDDLKAAGFTLCVAFRDMKITNKSWANKTPLPARLAYVMAVPKEQPVTKMAVSKSMWFQL